ncbi:heavy metal translocating P-type ATPase [Porticoccus sp. W117]|uniref:heavy metal translocating P-type ATPase n=1 Tax=Porticoccus sp. W117 TaxID=3054777 RepID=UPI002596D737|nr:heavy metal translocating P-type ATPase [Porticoccus sp. W117]MDM3871640.1 heavy metal translocating P-type ATPase [Porticoccus sp. W117]
MTTSCYHCGLDVPPDCHFPVTIEGIEQPMCCPGCQAVAIAIVDGGLGNFYKYRSQQQTRPEEGVDNRFAAYDLPEVQEEFVHHLDDGQLQVELLVEGITCAACSWLIEHHLQRIAGVSAVRVNVTTHRCWLSWNNSQVPLSRLLSALQEIGYRARPAGDEEVRANRKRENTRALQRLGVAGIGMMQAGMLAIALYAGAFDGIEHQWQQLLRWVSLVVATPVVLFAAAPFFRAAWRSLKSWHLVMDVPVSLAIGGAYLASVWATVSGSGEVYFDSVSMFTFFLLLGRYLEMRVRHRNEQRMEGLGQLLPPVARRVDDQGEHSVPVKALQPRDFVKVGPGDIIPCDGVVVDGHSNVVEAVLTGEQSPVEKTRGDAVSAGTVNSENPLLIEVQAVGKRTRLSAILQLVARAQLEKPRQLALADRLAGYFVGFVLLVSAAVAWHWYQQAPEKALWVTLSVLVVTCPCALSLATPTALAVATHGLRQRGLLVSRGHVMDGLLKIKRVVFDKTGTLTTGEMKVAKVISRSGAPEQKILAIAAALEAGSRHPIARAFDECDGGLMATAIDNRIGAGVSGIVDGVRYAIGREQYITELFGRSDELPEAPAGGEVWLLLASESRILGWILLRDQLRPDAADAVARLQTNGVQVELLSGDRPVAVAALASQLGISHWQGGISPEEKLAHVRQLQTQQQPVLMVGDGINDVPVLSGADVSVAMGDAADIARIHADSILMSSEIGVLPQSLTFAHFTHRIIRQNLGWALAYNLLALPLAALGLVPPWAAAIGMSASSLVVVLNALRLSRGARR